MLASDIHLMRSSINQMVRAFAEYNGLKEIVTHVTEMNKRLDILLDFAKETFFLDDKSASQNYKQLITEFRNEVGLLNTLAHIDLEQYPLAEDIVQDIGPSINEIYAGINHAEFDEL